MQPLRINPAFQHKDCNTAADKANREARPCRSSAEFNMIKGCNTRHLFCFWDFLLAYVLRSNEMTPSSKLNIPTEESMKRKKEIATAVILSGTLGLGVQSVFAQNSPGGAPTGPAGPGQSMPNAQQPGPTFPEPGMTTPQPGRPGVPTQPAPGIPQTKRFPGQPTPGSPQPDPVPGQTTPRPTQPGTVPEKLDPLGETNRLDRPGTSTENSTPQGSSLEGERRSITPPEPRSTMPQSGQSATPLAPNGSPR
jgi:hypothetical protein